MNLLVMTIAAVEVDMQHFRAIAGEEPSRWTDKMIPIALIGIGFIATLLIAWVIMRRVKQDRDRLGPVFRDMARKLALSSDQQQLIARVAQTTGRRYPASLLLSLGCFDHSVRKFVRAHGQGKELHACGRRSSAKRPCSRRSVV